MPGTIDRCECWLDIACSTAAADETCSSSCPVLIPLFRFGQNALIDSPTGESVFQREAPGTSFESLQAATCTALARPSWLRDGFRHYVLTDCGLTGCCLSTPGPNHVPQSDCCTERQFRSSCSLSRIACRHVTLSTTLPTALETQLDCPRTHTAEAFP